MRGGDYIGLEGASKKNLRFGFLQSVWSPQTEEGICDIEDHQAKTVMKAKIRYLGATEQKAVSWGIIYLRLGKRNYRHFRGMCF